MHACVTITLIMFPLAAKSWQLAELTQVGFVRGLYPWPHISPKPGDKLESRKVFAREKTVAGSNDYFGNLVIFKIHKFNSVRFTVIYKS